MPEVGHKTRGLEREAFLERIGEEFPNAEAEIPGIYPNGRLLDVLGAEPMTDFVGTFHEEMEQDPRTFRMALSELSDVIVYSERSQDDSGCRWRLHDTKQYMGWEGRSKILMEMNEDERENYEGLFGQLVSHHYWNTMQDWLRNQPYRGEDLLPFAKLQLLRLDLPSLEH
ncbi:hypothetical protein IH980_00275 [Patescibacteria group bacterium]|nr:hypothetical protein [Patescibacteria group bacterium]